ncbi:MAG: citrate/2-methylcitrate synthase [Rubrivivax sp.]
MLDTRITRMTPAGPAYRGRLATDLVREGHSFEAVAELLWTGELPPARPRWEAEALVPGQPPRQEAARALASREFARLLSLATGGGSSQPGVLTVLALALPLLAAADPLRFDAEPAAVLARARRLVPLLAASVTLALDARRLPAALDTADPVLALARALGVPERKRKAIEVLRTALVLTADHELNASTFAARVAASTGASLHACLSAALAAFSGPRHGGASEQVEWLVREAGEPARAAATVGDRLRRGERLAGFGHPLYPQGDPRAPPLLECAAALAPRSTRLRTVLALADAVHATGRPKANIDVGIAAACAALELPLGLGPALFAIGRTAGWVANVLEQQASPAVLRPRARFVGKK